MENFLTCSNVAIVAAVTAAEKDYSHKINFFSDKRKEICKSPMKSNLVIFVLVILTIIYLCWSCYDIRYSHGVLQISKGNECKEWKIRYEGYDVG